MFKYYYGASMGFMHLWAAVNETCQLEQVLYCLSYQCCGSGIRCFYDLDLGPGMDKN
jgi:hypothetical protein